MRGGGCGSLFHDDGHYDLLMCGLKEGCHSVSMERTFLFLDAQSLLFALAIAASERERGFIMALVGSE